MWIGSKEQDIQWLLANGFTVEKTQHAFSGRYMGCILEGEFDTYEYVWRIMGEVVDELPKARALMFGFPVFFRSRLTGAHLNTLPSILAMLENTLGDQP